MLKGLKNHLLKLFVAGAVAAGVCAGGATVGNAATTKAQKAQAGKIVRERENTGKKEEFEEKVRTFLSKKLKLGKLAVLRISKDSIKTGSNWKVIYFRSESGKKGVIVVDDQLKHVVPSSFFEVLENGGARDLVITLVKKEKLIPVEEYARGTISMDKVKEYSWCVGKGDSDRVVYAFVDPLCPFCAREISELIKHVDDGRLKLCLRWAIVHGKQGEEKAAAIECIRKKEGNRQAVEALLAKKFDSSKCSKEEMQNLRESVRRGSNAALGKVGVTGTPTLVIPAGNGEGYVFVGYHPYQFYDAVFKAMKAKSKTGSKGETAKQAAKGKKVKK